MNADNKPHQKWLAVSLKELPLLMAIVGLAVGWYLDHSRLVDSDGFRVGQGMLSVVQTLYETDEPGSIPVDFRSSFVSRPFQAKLSVSEYYADHPEERRPPSQTVLPFNP